MFKKKKKIQRLKNISWQLIGTLLLLFCAAFLILFIHVNNVQAQDAMFAQVRFHGEYRIGDGPWQTIAEGQHIPATKGDVTLRGNFHSYTPDGSEYIGIFRDELPIAFFTDHIGLTIKEAGKIPHMIDNENPLYVFSACAANWTAYSFSSDSTEPIEIIIHNPHRFGNETAVDELLSKIAIWGNIDFERGILASEKIQRNAGFLFVIVSIIALGTALFSTLLYVRNSHMIWMLGLIILFAGVYLAYSTEGVSFWSEYFAINTTLLGFSMMFYMLIALRIITNFLKETQKIGSIIMVLLGIMDGICFLLPVFTKMLFYDTWLLWIIAQTLANAILIVCMIKDFKHADKKERWIYGGMALLLLTFELDAAATAVGWWKGGFISVFVFVALFITALIVILRIVPNSINAAAKAKELELQSSRLEAEKNMMEAKLKESRISIMLSQIQPHFIYNTLGTIERMCLTDPEKAFELVRNFSLYLRGNFSELDSVKPIRFSEEMKHVEHYVKIEKVRFPDMNREYEIKAEDFLLPALSVQPLVENAIKHGLMRLESGGTVIVRSYETAMHFCVEVTDNGGGFDTSLSMEGKKHVGLRNIRERLKIMVGGELIIESKEGAGTKAVIKIPKEVKQ